MGFCLFLCLWGHGFYTKTVCLFSPGFVKGQVVMVLKNSFWTLFDAHGAIVRSIQIDAVCVYMNCCHSKNFLMVS